MTSARSPRRLLSAAKRRLTGTAKSAPRQAAERPGPKIGPRGIPGRFLRVIHTPEAVTLDVESEGSDPTEVAAVRAGWLLIDAHERMSLSAAQRVFGRELKAWHEYAETVTELNYDLPDGSTLVPESPKNRLRFRRTMDFAQPGDRVFDVGFGRGLLAAQLVKERGVASYHGIDVVSKYVPTATGLFEVNGLRDAPIDLRIGDLYDLTPEQVAESGATFVICCEVLEHVPDAEKALRVIADALPEGADLLFSVPLHGRLERAWGHVSVFDVARLKHMLAGAGLYAHHVEPLANTWSLVLASRDPAPSRRVREASGRPAQPTFVPLSQHRDFVDVPADDFSPVGGGLTRKSVRTVGCELVDGNGVTFPVDGLESLRLKFAFGADPVPVTRFTVTAYSAGNAVGQWVWRPKPGEIQPGTHRVSMRPGEVGAEFVSGPHRGVETADRVKLVVELPAGRSAMFGLSAAYLP